MLKKSNEEELSMLRAENAHMKRKLQEETVFNSSFETVQRKYQQMKEFIIMKVFKQGEGYLKHLELLPEYLLENIHFMML